MIYFHRPVYYQIKCQTKTKKVVYFFICSKFGITPWVPRNQVIPFSENIPDLDQSGPEWIPCDEENVDGSLTAQQRLSCMAKENQIYVVANMVDYKVYFCLSKA